MLLNPSVWEYHTCTDLWSKCTATWNCNWPLQWRVHGGDSMNWASRTGKSWVLTSLLVALNDKLNHNIAQHTHTSTVHVHINCARTHLLYSTANWMKLIVTVSGWQISTSCHTVTAKVDVMPNQLSVNDSKPLTTYMSLLTMIQSEMQSGHVHYS